MREWQVLARASVVLPRRRIPLRPARLTPGLAAPVGLFTRLSTEALAAMTLLPMVVTTVVFITKPGLRVGRLSRARWVGLTKLPVLVAPTLRAGMILAVMLVTMVVLPVLSRRGSV